MDGGKKFGLIMPKKSGLSKPKATSVFESDSDEDVAPKGKLPVIPQKKISLKSRIKEEELDPSIYEYDNIYDDMKAKQAESVAPKVKQSSRYIDTLMKAADKRKKEYERRVERKVQVEREKEGDQFKDKEEFVTSAYKKKMLEREEEEERERREAMLNDMMDVTKQKDLSGFYRHFLKQTVGEEQVPEFGRKDIKKEPVSDEDASESGHSGKDGKSLSKDVGRKKSSESAARQVLGADVRHASEPVSDEDRPEGGRSGKSSSKDVELGRKKSSESAARQVSGADVRHSSEKDAESSSKDVSSQKKPSEPLARQASGANVGHTGKNVEPSQKSSESEAGQMSGMSPAGDDRQENMMIDDDVDRDSDNIEIDSESDDNGKGLEKSYSGDGKRDKSKKDNQKFSGKRKSRDYSEDSSSEDESGSSSKKRNIKPREEVSSGTDRESSQSFKESNPKKVKSGRHKKQKSDSSQSGSDAEIQGNKKDKVRSKELKQPNHKSTRHDSDSSEDENDRDDENEKENLNNGADPETHKRKNIYAKRTVGDVFIQAQARFFQRMAARSS